MKRLISFTVMLIMLTGLFIANSGAAEPVITVSIKPLTEKAFDVDVQLSDTVLSLKEKIREIKNIPKEELFLVFSGKKLEDHKKLSEYDIKNGVTIYLVIGPHTCSGGAATCTMGPICNECTMEYGPALGHDWKVTVTPPACGQQGYSTYLCLRCGESIISDYTKALVHWYNVWVYNGDGTHCASCKRSGCDHVLTADCTGNEVTVDGNVTAWCPVCGVLGDFQMIELKDAEITGRSNVLPKYGEKIIWGIERPFDGVLYAFTVAYEVAGRVEPFRGKVSVAVPLKMEDNFKLAQVEVTERTQTTERTEVWTEIPFTYEGGILTFETDTDGLFLLLPTE